MKYTLDVKESFGKLLFLGYDEKMEYVDGKRTDKLIGYNCKVASSIMGGEIEVTVPTIVAVDRIAFAQEITLGRTTIDPYGRTTEGSRFAEVMARCSADNILDATRGINYIVPEGEKPGEKQGESKQGENKPGDKK